MLNKNCQSLEKSDVWSFGIVLLEIGARTVPYHDLASDSDVRLAIRSGILPKASNPSIWNDCPEWRKIMESCWNMNPVARPSFQELQTKLKQVVVSPSTSMGSPNPKTSSDLKRRKSARLTK
eukprot:TRINITY_DN2635_c0_g1_i35.p1 TRINITY_DN2635_c0_g1~~TRINITY_DN2635_c0_g1_i35.p1  ORF type:complete len:122 (-),score=17.84 TRINITY_DN2635_c0_g1_i35:211-576(-)